MAAAYSSTTAASGAFLATDEMPFSIDDADLYISLLPIGSPFAALRTKYGDPSFAFFRSKRASLAEFFLTESMPLTADARLSYFSLVNIT